METTANNTRETMKDTTEKQPTKFRIMRDKYGLTQSQAAAIMKRPLSTVKKWDAGFQKCSDRIIEEFKLRFDDEKKRDLLSKTKETIQ